MPGGKRHQCHETHDAEHDADAVDDAAGEFVAKTVARAAAALDVAYMTTPDRLEGAMQRGPQLP